MPARLQVYLPEKPARLILVEDGATVTFGRDPACEVVLDDPRISRSHARLLGSAAGWTLEDLRSKNGTTVEGRPADTPVELGAGAWLSFGGLLARFEVISGEVAAGEEPGSSPLVRWQTSLGLVRSLDPASELDDLLQKVLSSVLEASEAERAFVMLTRSDGEIELAATAGISSREMRRPGFAGSLSAVQRALVEAQPLALSDARLDEVLGAKPSVVEGEIRAVLCLPLEVVGRVIGVLYADSRSPGSAFTELDVEILSAMASHAALAIGVARLHREVESFRAAMPEARGEVSLAGTWDDCLPSYSPSESAHRSHSDAFSEPAAETRAITLSDLMTVPPSAPNEER